MGFLRAQEVNLRASSILLLSISEPLTEVNGCGGRAGRGINKAWQMSLLAPVLQNAQVDAFEVLGPLGLLLGSSFNFLFHYPYITPRIT